MEIPRLQELDHEPTPFELCEAAFDFAHQRSRGSEYPFIRQTDDEEQIHMIYAPGQEPYNLLVTKLDSSFQVERTIKLSKDTPENKHIRRKIIIFAHAPELIYTQADVDEYPLTLEETQAESQRLATDFAHGILMPIYRFPT